MVGTQFTALTDFFSEEAQSHYTEGLSYTVRDEGVLATLVPVWVDEGKVRLGAPNRAKVEGKG